jgi:hypothetical protein
MAVLAAPRPGDRNLGDCLNKVTFGAFGEEANNRRRIAIQRTRRETRCGTIRAIETSSRAIQSFER